MPSSTELTAEIASRFAAIALGHVAQPWPHKADHVFNGPEDVQPHQAFHPIFYGSFDWHSCVHGYWTLATCLRLFPDIPEAPAIRALFDSHLTSAKVEIERAYLDRPGARGFERPYGWAWLLKLQAELRQHDAPWAATLQPLANAFEDRFRAFLPLATYPIRTGVHSSTAFAIALALDYADPEFSRTLRSKFVNWHRTDSHANAWEPSQDDFLSPTLMEAAVMRRCLGRSFAGWFDRFLPDAVDKRPVTLFIPATPSDRTDGKIAHLDGLNLSRAWCWRKIAGGLPEGHPVIPLAHATAAWHLRTSLPHVTGDYMGEHWLASFALLALLA